MIEKLWRIQDNKGVFAALFTDISKIFDFNLHELLIAKVNEYRFDTKSLRSYYFTNRKLIRKILTF